MQALVFVAAHIVKPALIIITIISCIVAAYIITTTKGQTMTYNKMLYKKLQNMLNELNALIDQSHVFDSKYQQQLNDIYTKIDLLLEQMENNNDQ